MMFTNYKKTFVVPFNIKAVAVLVVCASCACQAGRHSLLDPRRAIITRFKIDPWRPDGYHFAYETSLGNLRKESGYLIQSPDGRKFLVTRGMYSYIGPDGKVYRVSYVADENGYHPVHQQDNNSPKLYPSTMEPDRIKFYDDQPIEVSTSVPEVQSTTTEQPSSSSIPPSPNTRLSESVFNELGETVDNRVGLPPALIGSLLG